MSARREPEPTTTLPDRAGAPPRRWRRLRGIGAWLLFVLLLLLVLVQTVYLLRQPLLAPMLRRTVASALGDALGGEAAIAGIDGDWLTHLRVHGVQLTEAGLLREVRDLELDVWLDPIALVRGDLGGLRRVRVRAAAVQLDLDAPGTPATAPAPATATGGPPDLAPLLALLPDGADVAIEHLTIRGNGTERAGRATVRVLPGTDPRRRRVSIDGPGAAVAATIARNGRIAAELAVADAAGVANLFAPLDLLQGGEARAAATLQLAPVFALDAELSVDGLRVRGRAVENLEATGHIDADGLSRLAADLRAPGVRVRTNDVSLSFEDALASLQGAVALDVRDLEPYAELLPPAVLAQLPLRGSLRAHAGGGRLAIDNGFFTAASGTVLLAAGAVRIDGRPTIAGDAPLRASLRLTDVARLDLPPDLPLQPRDGSIELQLLDRDGALAAEATLDLTVADAEGRSGRLRGDVAASLGPTTTVRHRLVLDGDLLRAAATTMAVHGEATLHPDRIAIAAFGIDLDDRVDAFAARGIVPLASPDLARLLLDLDVNATFARFRLDAAAPWLPSESPLRGIEGTLDGSARWSGGTADIELRAAATHLPGLAADAATTASVQLRLRDGALALERFDLTTPVGDANATASLPLPSTATGIDQLLAGTHDWQQQPTTATVEFDFAGLERLDLAPLLGLQLRGDVRGRLRTDGPLGAPLVEAETRFAGLTVGDGQQTFVTDLDGSAQFVDRTLHLAGLRGSAFAQSFALDGDAVLVADAVTLRALRVQDAHGGSVVFDGTMPLPRAGDWRAALGAADLRATAATDNLDPWLRLAGQPATGARLNAELQWRPQAEPGLDLRATASIAEFDVDGRPQPVQLELAILGDARGTRFTTLHAAVGDLVVDGTAGIALAPTRLLEPEALRGDAAVTADLVFAPTQLDALPAAMLGFAQIGGRLSATLQLAGTLQRPLPTATVDLAQAHFVTAGGQRLDDIEARLAIAEDRVQIDRLEATRGRGPIRIAGGFTAPGPLWRTWREGQLDLTIDGNDVQLHRRAGVKVRADVQLHAHGPLADVAIEGAIALRDGKAVARIPLLDLRHTGARTTTAGIVIPGLDLGPGFGGHLDVRITTREPFQVTNNVADGRFDVALVLQGPLAEPALTGTISGPEALVILPGMRLRASTLLVEFRRDNPRFPVVTATLRGRRHGYDVQAVVRGRYDRPQVLLSSNPPLAADELVVLVTTGARPDALRSTSGVSTVLGTYLAQELADWIFGSESTEAKESFLDRFTIESGAEISEAGTESLVVEFRLLDSVYLQGERDVYEDLNMGVVYRLKFR